MEQKAKKPDGGEPPSLHEAGHPKFGGWLFKGRPKGNDLKGRAVFEFVSGNLFGVTFLGPVLTGDLKETTLNIGVPNTL